MSGSPRPERWSWGGSGWGESPARCRRSHRASGSPPPRHRAGPGGFASRRPTGPAGSRARRGDTPPPPEPESARRSGARRGPGWTRQNADPGADPAVPQWIGSRPGQGRAVEGRETPWPIGRIFVRVYGGFGIRTSSSSSRHAPRSGWLDWDCWGRGGIGAPIELRSRLDFNRLGTVLESLRRVAGALRAVVKRPSIQVPNQTPTSQPPHNTNRRTRPRCSC